MEKINLKELLRNCPIGMELDCAIFDDATLNSIDESPENEYPIRIESKNGFFFNLTKYGTYVDREEAKCLIFPKGKTTWEGFVPPFKDGDICYIKTKEDNEHIFIFKNIKEIKDRFIERYVNLFKDILLTNNGDVCAISSTKEFRLANEDEKEKLFRAIKNNGYRWNTETMTLEKLPNFKEGDILYARDEGQEYVFIFKEIKNNKNIYSSVDMNLAPDGDVGISVIWLIDNNDTIRFATEEEKKRLFDALQYNGYKWNEKTNTLEKLPKFKVGNRIKNKYTCEIATIEKIYNSTYIVLLNGQNFHIDMELEKHWELVSPKKFDITDLKPFDKVLVRNFSLDKWHIQFFERYDKNASRRYPFVCICGNKYGECIPYEGNEHLLNTTDNCDKYDNNSNSIW